MSWNKHDNIIDASKWLKRQVELIEEKEILIQNKRIRRTDYIVQALRGGVFSAELGNGNIGGEKNKTRPVLVLSPNRLNKGNTVIVVPLSTKFKRKPNGLPLFDNHYLLKKYDYPNLDNDSVLKFEDIRCIDVVRLRKLRFNISPTDLKHAEKCLLFMTGY